MSPRHLAGWGHLQATPDDVQGGAGGARGAGGLDNIETKRNSKQIAANFYQYVQQDTALSAPVLPDRCLYIVVARHIVHQHIWTLYFVLSYHSTDS